MVIREEDLVIEKDVGAFEVKGEELPPELKSLGYTEIPLHKIILLLPEQLYELGISRTQILDSINHKRLAVYLSFRRLGWIIRDGANYGVDYLLYSGPPGTVHSKYGVMIYSEEEVLTEKGLTWRSFSGIARSVYNSKKEILVVKVKEKGENANEESDDKNIKYLVANVIKIERFLPNMKDSYPFFKQVQEKESPNKDEVIRRVSTSLSQEIAKELE